MTAPATTEQELKHAATERLRKTKDPVEILRLRCLSRGVDSIRRLGRYVNLGLWIIL